jgi:bifunctional lysine-specific demethylase and histidyl-hydroxylase MINA
MAIMTPSQARQILRELIGGEDAFAAFFEQAPADHQLYRASPGSREARALLGADPLAALKAAEPALGEGTEFTKRMTFPYAWSSFPRVAELQRALEAAFSSPVTADLHYGPGHAQGSEPDDDLKDRFIVQLAGSAIWQVESGPRRSPNPWWYRPGDARTAAPRPSSHATYMLGSGDLLYIPSGHWQEAAPGPGSMHVSLGFRPLTVRDAMIALLDHLSDEFPDFRSLAFGLADVRSGMWPDDELAWQAASRQIAARLFDLFNRTAPLDAELVQRVLVERRARFISALSQPSPQVDEKAVDRIALETPVGLGETIIGEVTANESTATLHHPFGTLSGPRRIEPALKYLLETERFVTSELPGALSDTERLALIRRLARCGVIRRIHAAEESGSGSGEERRNVRSAIPSSRSAIKGVTAALLRPMSSG